jgi:hypothetical protein
MMTIREAKQRASLVDACITKKDSEYRVTLREWPSWARSTEDKACYTDDLEDAVFTAQAMRRKAVSLKAETTRA